MPGKVVISDKDMGFRKLVESLGDMGSVTIGVQGKQAEEKHPDGRVTVGQVAAWHELGQVPGAPARSWLRTWMDANVERMRRETEAKLVRVLAGTETRNHALIDLGYKWTDEVRRRIVEGKITPGLAASTIKKKGGERRPLLDTAKLVNAITYKIFLPNKKSVQNRGQRNVMYGKGK